MPIERQDTAKLDAAWRSYLETGCPEALGRVYDGTSPILILIAVRLLGERKSSPERAFDLLQNTFIEAIRSQRSFDPKRPLLPWLTSIMTRRAIDLRRNEARRSAVSLDDQEVSQPDLDPARLAEVEELRGIVHQSLESLAPPYRTVLNLHLLHELSPLEISAALERPLATVHSQLRRGLARLRVRCREAVGSLPGVAWAQLDGMSQGVRASIVTTAHSTAGAPAVLASLYLTMKKTAVALGALMGLTSLTWYLSPSDPPEPATDSKPATASVTPIAREAGPGGGRMAVEEPENRRDTNATRIEPELELAWGRCVDQAGTPVPAARITVRSSASGGHVHATADASGRFRISVPVDDIPNLLPLDLRFRAKHHLERLVRERSGDLGDVQMVRGGSLRARLAPGALGLHHSWDARAMHSGNGRSGVRLRFTQDRLTFETETGIRPGRWTFHAGLSHAYEVVPRDFEIRAGEVTEIQLRPRLKPGISGVVLGGPWEGSRPIVQVEQRRGGGIEQAHRIVAGSDGRFTVWFEGDPANALAPRLAVRAEGHGYGELEVPWGTANLEVALPVLPRIVPRLVDQDGRAIQHYDVSITRDQDRVEWITTTVSRTQPESFGGFPRAPGAYRVWFRVSGRSVAGPFDVTVTDADVVLDARLTTDHGLRVAVEDALGQPVRRRTVILTSSELDTSGVARLPANDSPDGRPSSSAGSLLASAVTDENGVARLPRPQLGSGVVAVSGDPSTARPLGREQTSLTIVLERGAIGSGVETVRIALQCAGSLPNWIQTAWLVGRNPNGQRFVASGRRMGDAFWFRAAPVGPAHAAFADPALGFSESGATPLVVRRDASIVRIESPGVLPGRVDVPQLRSTVGIEILDATDKKVWSAGPGAGNVNVLLPAGVYTAKWIRLGEESITDTLVVTPGRSVRVNPDWASSERR